jgi:peptide/nickel transport system permease protein
MKMWQPLKSFWRLITYNLETKVGFSIVALFVLTSIIEAIGGYRILPYNPLKTFVGKPFSPPSVLHPFGTTKLGRDLFSMIIAGAPNDALVSFFVVGFSFSVGGLLGAAAGYVGGILDELLMRITDTFFAIPALILGMAIAMILGPSPYHLMFALAIIWWPPYARLTRSEALRLANMPFVASAKLSGISGPRIVLRHIFVPVLSTLLVYATLDIGTVVLTYSGLSYLGLAVRPPYPDWGYLVAQYQEYIIYAPWLSLIPAGVIMVVAAGFSLLGDGIRGAIQAERGR